jgi:hypothetical protein
MKTTFITSLAIAWAAALAISGPVAAQTEAEDAADEAGEVEEIVVTGSRLRRDSFNV